MEKGECSSSILSRLDLDDIEEVVWEPYHRHGPGRPPRNPLGIFKALIVKMLKQIPSDRELYRRLWNDPDLRDVCDIEAEQKPYHPSQLTRFRRWVEPERLEKIMERIIEELVEGDVIKGETIVLDATFIKAYSKRDPGDDSQGYSDPEARVGRDGKTYHLGYKAHIAVDAESELPVAFLSAPANENEKRHAYQLLDKTLEATRGGVEKIIADSQYSSKRFRDKVSDCGVEAVIPYPANQRPREKGLLRVDKHFRSHGPARERRLYRWRASVERTISRLKEQLGFNRHKVRGLRNITVHLLLCIITMLLVALAALRMKRIDKARSITLLGW
jgi:IS5 family transposase